MSPTTLDADSLQPKKLPAQARSRATFEAIVEGCEQLLPERGYGRTTTNHIAERAGVNIASLYEYFPGKDAIIAQVAERLVARVMRRLTDRAAELATVGDDDAVRAWLTAVYETISEERGLVAVFIEEVPYTNHLEPVRDSRRRVLALSRQLQRDAGELVQPAFTEASLHLVVNLVTSTILQLVLDPPKDVPVNELLDALVEKLDEWIRGTER
jgi:AcrR family transcriptional regulator